MPRAPQNSVPRTGADDLVPRLGGHAEPEREGLPRNYRMRADAHYVDQLQSPAQPLIRLLAAGQIECRDLPSADHVEALTKSIALHGVLQPLIIRRHGGRYILIAGRQRLAAAIAAGLTAVPCLLHEIDAPAAAAIAAADNLRADDPATSDSREQNHLRPLLETVTADLSTIRTSIALLRAAPLGGLPQQVGADLIEAQAARAAWLVSGMLGTFENTRLTTLAAIVQGVSDGFDAHATLTGMQLECSVTPAAAVWKLPEEAATAAINGAVFATLCSLEGIRKPRVELHADAPHSRALKIEVVQRTVRVHATLGAPGADGDADNPADSIPALALRLARAVAAPYGGSAEITPLPGRGSVLQITFANAQVTA
ncbi:MAG: ParB N-terminal domain-containing protein [Acidobacteria bacterium]|nr:ParB N-terminal domain-containing protein [Acidobacteriota bacterium]